LRGGVESGSRPAAQPPAAARLDFATIMGIPEGELTPKVRAAIDRLLAEVQQLRDQLSIAQKRIGHLETLADNDPLAPVLNRRAFVRELARMSAFAERYEAPGSIIYFDVNGLKRINDRHGHAAGDAAIKHVAEVLLREVRASDVVGRLGGDEFAVILAQARPEATAAKAASLAEAVANDFVEWDGEPLRVGVAYGTHTLAGGEGPDEALAAADRAMYARKNASDDAA
jgi:diguanylate cyclase (GGDEF)-like protein